MKYSEITELLSSAGIFLTGLGASLKGLSELVKATKKEPKKTARPRKSRKFK